MFRGKVTNHYVERDGDREVYIIPDGGVFNVYFVKGHDYPLSYAFGLPHYQSCENKFYDIDDAFHIAWDNFVIYEGMGDTDDEL